MKFTYRKQACVAQVADHPDKVLFSCPKLGIWDITNIIDLQDEIDRKMPTKTTGTSREELLVMAFKAAKAAALAADLGEGLENDGGTCNFDTPIIVLKGWGLTKVKKAAKRAGLTVSQVAGRYCAGNYFVHVPVHGQAMRRTKMAVAATKSLEAAGYEARMWYQAD